MQSLVSCAAPVLGASLVQASDGNFYGTNDAGCPAACFGTFFKLSPSGVLTRLYTFCSQPNCTDGESPFGLIQGVDGNFYGTTYSGGANGDGTVFRSTPSGALTTLYSFCTQTNCTDGALPLAPLIQGSDGNFYGSTSYGGANVNSASCLAEDSSCSRQPAEYSTGKRLRAGPTTPARALPVAPCSASLWAWAPSWKPYPPPARSESQSVSWAPI